VILTLVVACALGASDGTVTLRGPDPAFGAIPIRVDADGVLVRWPDRAPATQVLPLNAVRSVSDAQQGDWAEVQGVSEALWRAMSRLERGDVVMAEPILERLFVTYKSRSGPTTRVVAEGLLRCRISRQAHASAVEPWLTYLGSVDSEAENAETEAARIGPSMTLNSRSLRLFAALPPIWTAGPATRAFAESGARDSLPESLPAAIRALHALYVTAAAFESDGVERETPLAPGGDPVLGFVREIVASRVSSGPTRASARDMLKRRLSQDSPEWLHAWCRLAIARSLLREPQIENQRRAIIELIAVHAYYGRETPFLAGLALAEAARASDAIGDRKASAALMTELVDRYPGHPGATGLRPTGPDVRRLRDGGEAPDSEPSPPSGSEGSG